MIISPIECGERHQTLYCLRKRTIARQSVPAEILKRADGSTYDDHPLWMMKEFRIGSACDPEEAAERVNKILLVGGSLSLPVYLSQHRWTWLVFQPFLTETRTALSLDDISETGLLDDLALAHSHGLAHGDFKLNNFGINPDGRAHLFDWEPTLRIWNAGQKSTRTNYWSLHPADKTERRVSLRGDRYGLLVWSLILFYGERFQSRILSNAPACEMLASYVNRTLSLSLMDFYAGFRELLEIHENSEEEFFREFQTTPRSSFF